jgi:hypothetical protein
MDHVTLSLQTGLVVAMLVTLIEMVFENKKDKNKS